MSAPAVFVSTDSSEESIRDTIEIGVDVTHPMPVTSAIFPASTVEELRALRDRLDVVEVERATLRDTVRTMRAVEMVLRNRMRDERQNRIKIERQLALVQEELTQSRISHRQDQEDFKKTQGFHDQSVQTSPIDMLLHHLCID
ncbi:hypothetical protein Tco_1067238 [Tanacetum coccineum]|uniref:Uncharacterized protein n=1 Tax=Tanacetum coccineum TaxID=301880 RepID=A0ABQ5HCA7_9ASTR